MMNPLTKLCIWKAVPLSLKAFIPLRLCSSIIGAADLGGMVIAAKRPHQVAMRAALRSTSLSECLANLKARLVETGQGRA